MLDMKETLRTYLQSHRDALLWKLDGLGERAARWPMTTSGTNLLGLVKHVGSMEFDYLGQVFDRPASQPLPWLDDEADLDATGRVPWWLPGRQDVTLHRILVHMIAETARHTGHVDILREQIDGEIGLRDGNTNIPEHESQWWTDYVGKLQRVAEDAAR